jgi:hypothetical protein
MDNELLSSKEEEVPIEDKELGKEEIISLLAEGEELEEENKEGKKEEEEIKLNEEDEESDNKGLKEVVKAHPDLFKKFPFLKNSYYRERQFTELFPNPQDAEEAIERLSAYEELENTTAKGDASVFLKAVKEDNPRAFAKIVDSYLETLGKVDSDAHAHVISGVIKNLITSLVRESKRTDNAELRKVALAINRFAFDSDDFVPHEPLSRGKEDEVESEKEQWNKERFISTRDELDEQVTNVMKNAIMKHIDPKGQMSDYVKRTAVREALEEALEILSNDRSLKGHLNSLWKKVFDSNFNSSSRNAIKSAFLSKAQTVLPLVIKKARTEALRGLEKRVQREEQSEEEREPVRRRESTPSKRGEKNKVPAGMTTLDFLSQD